MPVPAARVWWPPEQKTGVAVASHSHLHVGVERQEYRSIYDFLIACDREKHHSKILSILRTIHMNRL